MEEEQVRACGFAEKCFVMDIGLGIFCGYFCEFLSEKDNKNYCNRFRTFVKTYISKQERDNILGVKNDGRI